MEIITKYKWLSKCFKIGTEKVKDKINKIFLGGKVDQESLHQLEELLITCDVGANTAASLISSISSTGAEKNIPLPEIKNILADEMLKIVKPVVRPITFTEKKPHIILCCGVNGNGKTTSLGKLAYKYTAQNKSVVIAGCDTFRAAANEQLEIWAKYSNCEIIKGSENADPASVAYKAIAHAKEKDADVVLVDTSGRIHTYKNFMEELEKIIRIIKKHDKDAPHNILLVLDATTGQNALNQVRAFKEIAGINGIILTKLDGTSKGGVIVSLAKQHPDVALHYASFGEGVEDIAEFSAQEFIESMLGVNQN